MVSAPYERKNEKTIKNCCPGRQSPYLEINIADLRKVFACTVTYILVQYTTNYTSLHRIFLLNLYTNQPSVSNIKDNDKTVPNFDQHVNYYII